LIDIKVFGSGSSGNGYLIDDGRSQILIECGVKFELVKRKMKFDLSKVAGMVISHEHGDHSKEIKKVLGTTAIDIFASAGTLNALNVPKFRANVLNIGQSVQIGTWTVIPFDVVHDAAEPMGFIFENASNERLLFVTDTRLLHYKFKNITHMMVEANYSMKILIEKYSHGDLADMLKNRIIRSHFEFENSKSFIKLNSSEKLQVVWLLHLSDSNSDEELFKREVQELTGVPVYIA
jgi:phosphoribosyl 1,2-cyclic phosphodiesterase